MESTSEAGTAQAARVREAREEERGAELAVFDSAGLADLASYWALATNDWRLSEEADYQADFHRHSGHDPEETRLGVYRDIREAVAQLFPPDYALPDLEWFVEAHGLHELMYEGLRGICSLDGSIISAVVERDADAVTTIEAYYDEDTGLMPETPLHVVRTSADGTREELTLLVPERGDEYTELFWMLEEGAEALAEAEDR